MNKRNLLIILLGLLLFLGGCGYSEPPSGQQEAGYEKSHRPVAEQKAASDHTNAGIAAAGEKKRELSEPQKITPPTGQVNMVRLVVTSSFGQTVIYDKQLELGKGKSALDITKQELQVKTAYGGGFVQTINGISSGYTGKSAWNKNKQDWFLYHNGCLSAVGSGDLHLQPGDTVWWDFHDWSASVFSPAILGAYPWPFSKGGVIAASHASEEPAGRLKEFIEQQTGANIVLKMVNNEMLKKRSSPTIIIGRWSELKELPCLQDLWRNSARAGMFCRVSDEGIKGLDCAMNRAEICIAKVVHVLRLLPVDWVIPIHCG